MTDGSMPSAADEPPSPPAPGAGSRLTAEQAAVLRHRAAGLGTAEVAAALGIAGDEVREHLMTAMRRLDAVNEIHALILAYRAGLIELPRE